MNKCIPFGASHSFLVALRRISLRHKDLRQGGRAKFDVTPLLPTTYDELQNAMQNAKR
jgi:hypothetical protein